MGKHFDNFLVSGYSIVCFTFVAALLFRDLAIDFSSSSVEDAALYYRLTSEIPSPFLEVIFITQFVVVIYLVARILKFKKTLDTVTLIFQVTLMIIYIYIILPTIQYFSFHKKLSEALFIIKYHAIMFALAFASVTLQILSHKSHRTIIKITDQELKQSIDKSS